MYQGDFMNGEGFNPIDLLMMAGMGGAGNSPRPKDCGTMKSVAEKDLPKGFQPIDGLKTGDRVRAKSEQYNQWTASVNGNVLIVHRVGTFKKEKGNGAVFENDFTTILMDEDTINEFAYDSRFFERVPENEENKSEQV
jgi:hypothetical protein